MPNLGIGSSLTSADLVTPGIVTSNLVLKHNYAAGGVVPVSDGAMFTDGINDYLNFGGGFNLSSDNFSMGGWFWISSSQDSTDTYVTDGMEYSTLFGRAHYPAVIQGFMVRYNHSTDSDADLMLLFGDGIYQTNTSFAPDPTRDAWNHIMFVKVATDFTFKAYLNGGQVNSNSGTTFDKTFVTTGATGVIITASSGASAEATSLSVDNASDTNWGTGDAAADLVDLSAAALNKVFYKSDGSLIGTCTAVPSVSALTFGGGLVQDVSNNDELYVDAYAESTTNDWHLMHSSNLNALQSFCKGYVSNVGLWDRTLTQAEVKSIMWKNYAGLTSSETTNLVSWWNLDSTIDSTATLGHTVVYDNHYSGGDALGDNLIANSTFSGGVESPWADQNIGAGEDVDPSTEQVYIGTHSLKIIGGATSDGTATALSETTVVGKLYRFEAWFYVTSGAAKLNPGNTPFGGYSPDTAEEAKTTTTNQWEKLVTYAWCDEAASGNALYIACSGGAATFYVDNIKVQIVQGNPGELK